MDKSKTEVCTIRIMFPVESDEEAIACKKKIAEVLSGIEGVIINFSISNMSPAMPPR